MTYFFFFMGTQVGLNSYILGGVGKGEGILIHHPMKRIGNILSICRVIILYAQEDGPTDRANFPLHYI